MQLLGTFSDQSVVPADMPGDYTVRHAARAVLLDEHNRIVLLRVGKHGYHKLPGGGVDAGESLAAALAREVQEEVGCALTTKAEIGRTDEYWELYKQFQQSFCFLANTQGELGHPDFTDEEKREGFALVWADSIEEAIDLLERDRPDDQAGRLIQKRDLLFMKTAHTLLA